MSAIAIFGGSFNPPHVGHVLAACWAMSAARFDALLVVPTVRHAFGKPLAPFAHRRRMAELAFGGLVSVSVSDVESRLDGPSYTVSTLERVQREHPSARLTLVVGSDLVPEIPRWHDAHRLDSLAERLVIPRPGYAVPGDFTPALPEVSSTDVRERLARGESVRGLVPLRVAEYIAAHELYREAP
ncbi:MAG: nicotinate (nicotinamide) nucleotide adenylyltransferase [Sandaracinaceae bacterium]